MGMIKYQVNTSLMMCLSCTRGIFQELYYLLVPSMSATHLYSLLWSAALHWQ